MRDRKWWEDTIQAVMSQIEMGYDLYEIKHKYLIDNWNLSEQQADWVINTAQQRLRQQQSPQWPTETIPRPVISQEFINAVERTKPISPTTIDWRLPPQEQKRRLQIILTKRLNAVATTLGRDLNYKEVDYIRNVVAKESGVYLR